MGQTFMQKQHNQLVKKFHTLLTKGGIDNDAKMSMLASYGVTSSREMNTYELMELCGRLDRMVNGGESSKFRQAKRTLGVLCKYFEKKGYVYADPVAAAKGMVCRIVGTSNFNRVGEDRLRSIYGAFSKRLKDMERAPKATDRGLEALFGSVSEN